MVFPFTFFKRMMSFGCHGNANDIMFCTTRETERGGERQRRRVLRILVSQRLVSAPETCERYLARSRTGQNKSPSLLKLAASPSEWYSPKAKEAQGGTKRKAWSGSGRHKPTGHTLLEPTLFQRDLSTYCDVQSMWKTHLDLQKVIDLYCFHLISTGCKRWN